MNTIVKSVSCDEGYPSLMTGNPLDWPAGSYRKVNDYLGDTDWFLVVNDPTAGNRSKTALVFTPGCVPAPYNGTYLNNDKWFRLSKPFTITFGY